MVKFDYYSTTIGGSNPEKTGLVGVLLNAWELSDWRPAKPRNGYHYGGAIYRGDRSLCHLAWGGQPGISCTSSSTESITLEHALRTNFIEHRPTRVDACYDMDSPGLFDRLAEFMIAYAQRKRITIDQRGDWVRGEARTLYLGSKSSTVRVCMYEKGFEQGGGASKDWVRFEVRVKPKDTHRDRVSKWSPANVFQAGFVHEIVTELGWFNMGKENVSTIWQPSDEDKVVHAMLRQYGRILRLMAEKHSGDWQEVGKEIGQRIEVVEG